MVDLTKKWIAQINYIELKIHIRDGRRRRNDSGATLAGCESLLWAMTLPLHFSEQTERRGAPQVVGIDWEGREMGRRRHRCSLAHPTSLNDI